MNDAAGIVPMPDDLYSILGLTPGCTVDEIKQAYYKLAKQFHPDVNASPAAVETMKRINNAYAVLSDPEKRRSYDEWYISRPRPEYRRRQTAERRYSYREPAPKADPNINYHSVSRTSSRVKAYALVMAVVLLSMSYLFILPLVHNNPGDSPVFTYSPKIPVATPVAASQAAAVQRMPVTTTPIPHISPCPTPAITPTPIPTATAVPSAGQKASVFPVLMAKSGIVKGRITEPGAGIWPGDIYVAICDANDKAIRYYQTFTGPGGYFQLIPVNNTMGLDGVIEERYVLYARDNQTKSEACSRPFGVGPYAIVTEDLSLS
ncbi:MAG TPA: J domain-containing protein [Methanocella sp.]|uniref:J domain-containing protein n=1 Tax=Methanocella sp. TaxID=2052833 RepID=UPI002CB11900|nr:J domain-containing protein [Methanocella sp.]HTY90643.1 J domain-containing protein [Methanocella sp.]